MTGRRRTPRWDVVTVLVFLGFAIAYYGAVVVGGGGLRVGSDAYEIDALAPTAASLATGARVTVAGIDVGRVQAIKRQGAAARLTLRITDDRVTPLPADSRIQLRGRSPVGENYVQIVPGRSAGRLESGDVVGLEQAGEYVDVDQVLSVLRGSARRNARALLQGVGGALKGRGNELHAVVGDGTDLISSLARIIDTVDPRRENVSRLVDDVGVISTAVGERGDAIRALAVQGERALTAIADQDVALRNSLRQLPPTLDQLRSTAKVLRRADSVASPVVANLGTALADLRAPITALAPAARTTRTLLGALDDAGKPVRGLLGNLRTTAPQLAEAVPEVRSILCQVNPMLAYLRPYTTDLLDTLTGLGSLSNAYDATGHTARLGLLVSDDQIAGLPDSATSGIHTLLNSGLLGTLKARSYNPYPKPGRAGTGVGRAGGPQGPSEIPSTGYVYPRIQAEC